MDDSADLDARLRVAETAIAQLSDLIAAGHTERPSPPAEQRPTGPSIWCWKHLTDEDRGFKQWSELSDWVTWLADRYPKALRELPPCWYTHTDAVEEFTALWAAWLYAYYGGDEPREAMIVWHDRWLPGVVHRLLDKGGVLAGCAAAKKHRPVNLAGAPRNSFDPVLDEQPVAAAGS